MLGIAGIIFTTSVVGFESPTYHNYYIHNPEQKINLAHFSIANFDVFSISFFAFANFGILSVKESLKNSTIKRMNIMIDQSVLVEMIIYMTLGAAGYWGLCSNTPDIIILRPKIPGSNDILMTIA